MTVTARDALAAQYFPREWAAVVDKVGASKARQKLRQRAEAEHYLEKLRKEGRSCATCRSFDKAPFGIKEPYICQAFSDFHGYSPAKKDGLCIQWVSP